MFTIPIRLLHCANEGAYYNNIMTVIFCKDHIDCIMCIGVINDNVIIIVHSKLLLLLCMLQIQYIIQGSSVS